jgi:transcriptional regulator with XRE-family HTH domain
VNKTVKRAKLKKFAPKSASTIDRYIGARMREQRLALSMSQHQLGKELGVSFQQIQKYKSGKPRQRSASLRDLQSLECLAGVHVRARSDPKA